MKRPKNEIPAQVVPIDDIGIEDEQSFKKKDIETLAAEIEEKGGLLYPVVIMINTKAKAGDPSYVMRKGWGRKRLEAAHHLKWKTITAVVIPPIDEVAERDSLLDNVADLIGKMQMNLVTDYDIGKIVSEMEQKHGVKRNQIANIVGLSQGYMYNLVRWYRNVPNEVRDAWKNDHPHMNQALLDKFSHMEPREAAVAWKKIIDLRSSPTPYMPDLGKKNGHGRVETEDGVVPVRKRPHRASETQMANLMAAINDSVLKPEVKQFGLHVIKFALGLTKNVPGITDYQKLKPEIIDLKATKKQQKAAS